MDVTVDLIERGAESLLRGLEEDIDLLMLTNPILKQSNEIGVLSTRAAPMVNCFLIVSLSLHVICLQLSFNSRFETFDLVRCDCFTINCGFYFFICGSPAPYRPAMEFKRCR